MLIKKPIEKTSFLKHQNHLENNFVFGNTDIYFIIYQYKIKYNYFYLAADQSTMVRLQVNDETDEVAVLKKELQELKTFYALSFRELEISNSLLSIDCQSKNETIQSKEATIQSKEATIQSLKNLIKTLQDLFKEDLERLRREITL